MLVIWLWLLPMSSMGFSLSTSSRAPSSGKGTVTTTTTSSPLATPFTLLMRNQAGGGSNKRKKNKKKNSKNHDDDAPMIRLLPEPLINFEDIRSVSLQVVVCASGGDMTEGNDDSQDEEDDEEERENHNDASSNSTSTTTTKVVMAKVHLAAAAAADANDDGSSNSNSNTSTSTTSTTSNNIIRYVDPRTLHQTADYRLWMTLRDQVDVSASQFSVVLDTSYFTSRQSYLQQKINSGIPTNNNHTLSAACAWGIQMEPLAFQQYQRIVARENNHATVTETGMHILTHQHHHCQHNNNNGRINHYYTFGASPDGMVIYNNNNNNNNNNHDIDGNGSGQAAVTKGLLEIKSLWGRRHNKGLPQYDHCPNRYYDQIQGQLAICDLEWCDLMLFIPPGGSNGGNNNRRKKNNNKKKTKRKTTDTQQKKKDADDPTTTTTVQQQQRPRHGPNYSIVRVYRNRQYWNETLLPALVQFCDEVHQKRKEQQRHETTASSTALT
jgi:YqaJ-like viral recombinase domain